MVMLNLVIKLRGEGVRRFASDASEGGKKKEKKEKRLVVVVVVDVDLMEKVKFVVGCVIEVGCVENSDKLYLCKVDCGEENSR